MKVLTSIRQFQELLETLSPIEFERFVFDVLTESGQFSKVELTTNNRDIGVDIIGYEKETITSSKFPTKWLIEVKRTKLIGVDTIRQLIYWFSHFGEANIKGALVTLGQLSAGAKELSEKYKFTVLGLEEIAGLITSKVYEKYFGGQLTFAPKEKEEPKNVLFANQLQSIKSGKEEWSNYQKLISDILELLFIPPLESPRYEYPDREADNRRDMIFENSATSGFWKTIKDTYEGHYIVVDAKNYSDTISKKTVIEIAHYLKPYGCGMFGIIACRKGVSKSSKSAIREQWIGNKKLIVVIDDNDILEMLKLKSPEEVIRRKIADFRMEL
jgi:HJR/Mrr/RecB family endonuclease